MNGKNISKIAYVNRIEGSVLGTDEKERENIYNDIRSSDCLIVAGAGRSFSASKIAFGELAKCRPDLTIGFIDDPGFPGNTMRQAAPAFESKYDKTVLIVNSGSGKTYSPYNAAFQLGNYIEKTGTKKFTIDVITSNLESPIGNIGKKYGSVLVLKDSHENKKREGYRKAAIMRDKYELGSLVVQQTLSQMLCEDCQPQRFEKILEKEFPKIGSVVDDFTKSNFYYSSIDNLEGRANVFIGGTGVANEEAEMVGTRMAHIKHVLGDEVYIVKGPTTPRPRPKDFVMLRSYSGGSKFYPGDTEEQKATVLDWAEKYRKAGATIFSIVGKKNCPLEEFSDKVFYFGEESRGNKPRWWYTYAAFAESPMPISLTEKLKKRGLKLPPYILEWFHATAE